MAAKRSRLGRSSSSGDTSVLSAPIFESNELRWPLVRPSPSIAAACQKPVPEKIRPSIFTLSSPIFDPLDCRTGDRMRTLCLDKCSYCRKGIAVDAEVFMYSMRAFCTVECREKQIEMDKDPERLSATPRSRPGKRAGV